MNCNDVSSVVLNVPVFWFHMFLADNFQMPLKFSPPVGSFKV
jgi:hypothetical protein